MSAACKTLAGAASDGSVVGSHAVTYRLSSRPMRATAYRDRCVGQCLSRMRRKMPVRFLERFAVGLLVAELVRVQVPAELSRVRLPCVCNATVNRSSASSRGRKPLAAPRGGERRRLRSARPKGRAERRFRSQLVNDMVRSPFSGWTVVQ